MFWLFIFLFGVIVTAVNLFGVITYGNAGSKIISALGVGFGLISLSLSAPHVFG